MDKKHYDFIGRAFCGCSTYRCGDKTTIKRKVTCLRCQRALRIDGYRGEFITLVAAK